MFRRAQAGSAALVVIIYLVFFVSPVIPASAQTPAPVIETADLRLWPEYDDPGLLVVLAGQFAPGTTFPLKASFPVPPGVRNVQATYQDASGSLINRPFEIKDGVLSYELPAAGFQLEYYLDRAPSSDGRNIAYSFVAPYAISALRAEVQEPARASSFALTPASEISQKASDGLTYHVFNRRNLAAGEKLDTTIGYSKADSGLSAPQLAVAQTSAADQPLAAAAPSTAAPATNPLPWILIGLGLVLLVGILTYWFISQRRQPELQAATNSGPASVRAKTSPPAVRPTAPARQTGEAVSFCTNCGHGLKSEDRFCSQCGAPRRS